MERGTHCRTPSGTRSSGKVILLFVHQNSKLPAFISAFANIAIVEFPNAYFDSAFAENAREKLSKRHFITTTLAALAIVFLSTLSFARLFQHPRSSLPHVHDGSVSSTNWSGFAVRGSSGSITDAKGCWMVQTIQGTCPSTNQYSSFWVGIDGYSSGTVEQTGTDSDCQNGVPTYYAWYEFFPHPSFLINGISVHPGDIMSAEARASGNGKFTVSITDTTTHQSFSTSSTVHRAQQSSAEWIAEAPSSSGGILPLADFGTAHFGLDITGVSSTCFATISGTTAAFGTFGSNVQQITMVTSGGATKASPSNPSSDNTSFSVTWVSSGP
jgi:hypothetical protein